MLWVTKYGKEIDMSEMTDTHLQRAIGHMERIGEVGDSFEIDEWRLEGLRAEQRRRVVSTLEAQVQALLKRVSDLEVALAKLAERL